MKEGLLPRAKALVQTTFNMTGLMGSQAKPSFGNSKIQEPGQSWFALILDLPAGWEHWCSFGSCYPRYLGITRRSCLEAHMVLDMEYREQERPEHGPGGPIFFFSASFVLPAVPASITTDLGLYQKGFLLHEVIGLRYHGMCHI
jgi:hypothetical protein